MKFMLTTDSCSDMPYSYADNKHILLAPLRYTLGEQEFEDDNGRTLDYHDFYRRLQAGESAKTSLVNLQKLYEIFMQASEKGMPVLHLSFAAALSGTFGNAILARNMVLEKRPQADITVVDSKSASLGMYLLLDDLVEKRDQGWTKEETLVFLKEKIPCLQHFFVVDDLAMLERGGRINHIEMLMGKVLKIKPVLALDQNGKIGVYSKVRGRKKALALMVAKVVEDQRKYSFAKLVIAHSDAEIVADDLINKIRAEISIPKIQKIPIGPVIGTHTGKGTLGVAYYGGERI